MITDYVESFYVFKLSDKNIQKIDSYVNNLTDLNYLHNEFDFDDVHHDVYHKVYRSCEIHYPSLDSVLGDIAYGAVSEINNDYYQFDLSDYELQLIKYHIGGRYEWHSDYGSSGSSSAKRGVYRKLSMTIQLSDSSQYDGGELEIVDYSNRTHVVPNEKGIFVVFDSRIPHRVKPITRGERIALVGWASGPKLR
jgi:Rps23 Pro-64 3,4-dihydroxylase Tpa1-like proline 4-hydroxylase